MKTAFTVLFPFAVCVAAVFSAEPTPNTWVRITPSYRPAAGGGMHYPQSWNKLVYDPVNRRVYCADRWYDSIRNGTIYANSIIALDLAADTAWQVKVNNWKRQSNASGGYSTVPLPENVMDPTPVDRHPYGCFVYVPEKNALYLTNGANQTAPGGHPRNTWRFDVARGAWDSVETPNPPNNLEDAMSYDDFHRKIVYSAHGKATWVFDIDTEQWSQISPTGGPTTDRMAHMMAYDSKRHLTMLFGGGPYPNPGRDLWALDLDANTWTRKADCPVSSKSDGWCYSPRHDVFLAIVDSVTYVYNPATDAWSVLNTAQKPHCVYQTMTYDTVNDLFVVQGGSYTGVKWWVMRYDPELAAAEGVSAATGPRFQAAPNPFKTSCRIRVETEGSLQGRLEIFNASGQRVSLLHQGLFMAGPSHYVWDAGSGRLPAGIYMVRLSTQNRARLQKIFLIK